ncbi:MAG: peptidoglycan DD-metalloendopeptidase family protein [Chloroflexota bacterium]|nr:peptidoglycan DD-metalloendopeptidase family protein [Chloroflexota bacterium]
MTTPIRAEQPEPSGAVPSRRHPVAITALILLIVATAVTVATREPTSDAVTPTVVSTPGTVADATPAPSQNSTSVPTQPPKGTPGPSVTPAPSATATAQPSAIIDSNRYSYEPGWGTLEVQAFLDTQPGTLKSAAYSAGGQRISLAAAIADQSLLYNINPKVLLTILEMESGLVRGANPSPNEIGWAVGYRQDKAWGLGPQVNWAARELYRSAREDPSPIAARGWGSFAVARLLSQTVDRDTQGWTFERSASVFVQTYKALFGEDPRIAPTAIPAPAAGPFLRPPYALANVVASSAFDHEFPTLSENGSMVTSRGQRNQSSYDGHDGWDYVLSTGNSVLAAAAGRVLVAGWSDDACAQAAGAVILDHENGYRTLYWHLSSVGVKPGDRVVAGDVLGKSGNTGCSLGAHLHFGTQYLGKATDPNGWCPEGTVKADPWAAHPAGIVSLWLWTDRSSQCTVR